MFDEQKTIEFFNRIINAPEISDEEIEENVAKFHEYLSLTHMCDEDTLEKLGKIVECLHEILVIRNTIGYVDVSTLLLAEPEPQMRLTKKPKKATQTKHYNHYHSSSSSGCGGNSSSSSSSSCWGSSTSSSSCGGSSSSSCGGSSSSSCGGSSYSSRC
jgi:hypothetical protein